MFLPLQRFFTQGWSFFPDPFFKPFSEEIFYDDLRKFEAGNNKKILTKDRRANTGE